jgi:hypothetical protein
LSHDSSPGLTLKPVWLTTREQLEQCGFVGHGWNSYFYLLYVLQAPGGWGNGGYEGWGYPHLPGAKQPSPSSTLYLWKHPGCRPQASHLVSSPVAMGKEGD